MIRTHLLQYTGTLDLVTNNILGAFHEGDSITLRGLGYEADYLDFEIELWTVKPEYPWPHVDLVETLGPFHLEGDETFIVDVDEIHRTYGAVEPIIFSLPRYKVPEKVPLENPKNKMVAGTIGAVVGGILGGIAGYKLKS